MPNSKPAGGKPFQGVYRGTIKSFNARTGYGFLTPMDSTISGDVYGDSFLKPPYFSSMQSVDPSMAALGAGLIVATFRLPVDLPARQHPLRYLPT